jgi:hypothetical protein
MHSIDYVPPSHAAARLMLEKTTQNETVFPQYFGLVGSWGPWGPARALEKGSLVSFCGKKQVTVW